MSTPSPELSRKMPNAIRILSVDAVEKAKSGHPGAPMGMADIAQVLWSQHLNHNPKNPNWFNRDRFVLSNGHGSMLIYSLLHLTGYDLPMEEIKNFRQLHSKTAGHPEYGITPGVETTTGPLGQGIANAVGMALSEKLLSQEFNKPDHSIVDHFTYVFMGDGCMMEGISHEACALAGTLKLSKLIAFWDDNGISIDGHVEDWFSDDTPERFAAYGWNVISDVDGHNYEALEAAISAAQNQAKQPDGKPTLICCKTIIGKGAPHKQGSHDVHGAPLGAEEVAAVRATLDWNEPPFVIPADIKAAWDATTKGAALESEWDQQFAAYRAAYPTEAAEFERRMNKQLPADFNGQLTNVYAQIAQKTASIATRKASQNALDALAPLLPELFGGSADLTGSNLTNFKDCVRVKPDVWGNHLSYGVREFAMAAMMNGIALHGGYIPYGGTFLTFCDYSRNAIRMAALMKQRVIHVFTHDSIGLGEDGPTHQSVEHVPSLRIIPNLDVWRPADGLETAVAWGQSILRDDGPSALILSRQNLPNVTELSQSELIAKGGYVLKDAENPQALIIATGSEIEIALKAQAQLAEQGIAVRVVSMPCTQAFDRQTVEYRQSVLPVNLPAVAVEAAQPDFWHKYVGRGSVVGMTTFGESAPANVLYEYFGITAEKTAEAVKQQLQAV